MKNHKIFKKYKDAVSYANDLIDGIKGEVLFDDAWDDYLVNGENTGDCKLYKNGKFIKTINTDDGYKWSNLIMLYKKDDGFMVYTDFEFDESKKSVHKSMKEKEIGDKIDDIYFDGFPTFIENDIIVTYDDEKYLGFIKEFYTDGKIMSIIAYFEEFYVFAVLDYRKKPIIAEALNSYNEAKKKFIESQK